MRRGFRRRALTAVAGGVFLAAHGGAGAQTPPSRPPHIGGLELVATLGPDQPAGVAVSDSGRLFVTFPRHDGPVAATLAELKQGVASAYPSAALNQPSPDRAGTTLFSVQTAQVDASNHLWALDTGTLQFGQPPVTGAPKLVEIDLATNRVLRTIVIPSQALVSDSALKDFRLDFHLGNAGVAFITDSAPNAEAMIVLDLASGGAVRRLTGAPQIGAESNRTAVIGSQPLMEWPVKPKEQGAPHPWRVGLNAIEISADGKTLYFSAFTTGRLLALPTADAGSADSPEDRLKAQIRDLGPVGIAGHFALDENARLYFMDMEHDAIYRRFPDGRTELVVMDPRLIWPDTLAIGRDEYLYVTTSQNDLRPEFHDGDDQRQRPYGLYRVFVGATPIRASGR